VNDDVYIDADGRPWLGKPVALPKPKRAKSYRDLVMELYDGIPPADPRAAHPESTRPDWAEQPDPHNVVRPRFGSAR
jgi:hypothetical protein